MSGTQHRFDLEAELSYAQAINQIARSITHDVDTEHIRQAMVDIIGKTLDVDRALIYDVRFGDEQIVGLSEWLNPRAEGIEPTIATYPLSVFRGGAEQVRDSRRWMVSHDDAPHAALSADGSGEILHQVMCIKSLLWFPFDFGEQRFFVLVFNQVRMRRDWSDADMRFVGDIAELVSMAHLRIRLQAQTRAQQQRDEQRNRLEGLGLLAGGVAHDFNNLLTAILGNVELMRLGPLRDDYLANIEAAVESGAAMCQQLLTYTGQSDAAQERLDARALIAETVPLLGPTRAASVRLELADEPIWVVADRAQLQQVFLNLITNGIEALDEGGHIVVRSGVLDPEEALAKHVAASAEWSSGARPYLQVEDDGVGLSDSDVQRIFEPFFTTKPQGHGLGLAAVHGVIDTIGAAIGVQSEVGVGTTFTIVFPEADSPGTHGGAPSPAPVVDPTSPRVLVVDDELLVRRVCASSLALGGHRVVTAGSGEEALAIWAAHPTLAVIVLDIGLPGLDGRQTFVKLRARGCKAAVVFISAHPIGTGFAGSDLPDWTYLAKPFRPERLLETVARMWPDEVAES